MSNTWNGIRVRKGENYGTVVNDSNYFLRVLTIKMDDGTKETITMNNVGADPEPEKLREWEWFWDKSEPNKWYRF